MPSGLLNGKGCYDSIRKSEDYSPLFLSIRHHTMPFVIDEREARAKLNAENSIDNDDIHARVKEQFTSGALPFLRTIAKCISMVLVFPFHFLFKQLPDLINSFIVNPCVAFLKKAYESIVVPCRKVFYSIYNPLVAICNKIQGTVTKIAEAIKAPCIKAQNQLLVLLRKIHVAIVLPPKRVLRKGSDFLAGCSEQLSYRFLVSKIWIKLLFEHSLSCFPTVGKREK